jgi:DNA processing protein
MDLQTAVAASMLPASRTKVAFAFKDVCYSQGSSGPAFLELLWAAAGRSDPLSPAVVSRVVDQAQHALEEGRRLGIQPVPLGSVDYPPLLACIPDPPPVLWIRGMAEALSRPAVALIGSRAATPYALQVAGRIAGELAVRGILVVSGLARGVDSAAHRGCLEAGGATLAVQGCGLDRTYPAEHVGLAGQIAEKGLLVAELAPGAPPLPEHFPLRNRIISGLTLATVVVEASEQSGSLITARAALEQGRDVMAVPGSVLTGRNRGSHALLKDGAKVVETADDILQELGWSASGVAPGNHRPPADPLLERMEPGQAQGLEELASASGLDPTTVLARLMELELAGLVTPVAGRFVRRA